MNVCPGTTLCQLAAMTLLLWTAPLQSQDPAPEGSSAGANAAPTVKRLNEATGNRQRRIVQTWSKELAADLFHSADKDASQWLSLRELRSALRMDRREYSVFDRNLDGMISLEEFETQLRKLIENGAVFPKAAGLRREAESRPANSGTAEIKPAASRPAGVFRFGK